jgi:hypothetical protein
MEGRKQHVEGYTLKTSTRWRKQEITHSFKVCQAAISTRYPTHGLASWRSHCMQRRHQEL